jgi:hypothetical protein
MLKETNFILMRPRRIPGDGGWLIPRGRIFPHQRQKRRDQPITEMMMRMEWKQAVLMVMGVAALGAAACPAQSNAAGQGQTNSAPPARGSDAGVPEFTIGVSGYEAITKSTAGNGTQQTASNAGGGILEMRFIANTFAGLEFTYSYNPAHQTIAPAANCSSYENCADPKTTFAAKASVVGVDYVISKKIGSLRPFAVGGLGFFITSPPNSTYAVQTVVRPDIIAGGGVDWAFLAHVGLRVQVRDNIYKAPNLSSFNPPTGQYSYSLEPMGGVYYSF